MEKLLLKNGRIIDGTGKRGFVGDVLIKDKTIMCVRDGAIQDADARIIDCSGLAVAPGFIDAHSHNDFYIFARDEENYIGPFIRQGITTFIGGNCGHGVAGFQKDSAYVEELTSGLFSVDCGEEGIPWRSWAEFHGAMERRGIMMNMATLAAHGAALGSLIGVDTPAPDGVPEEINEKVLELLEAGMDEGCVGVSLGLAYRPGNFTSMETIKEIAKAVAKRGKVLTVHRGVEGNVSSHYKCDTIPHNVRWLSDLFTALKDTGCRIHLSHLLFPGRETWKTYDDVMALMDHYRAEGMDITFDLYPYSLGQTEIALQLNAKLPREFERLDRDREFFLQKKQEFDEFHAKKGALMCDVILCHENGCEELSPYRGMTLENIAKKRELSDFENVVDIYRKTEGRASVFMTYMYGPGQIEKEMVNDHGVYMTDAWFNPGCTQNPCAYGSMPRFLRIARETQNLTLEEAVAHMTGKTADLFGIRDRGYLREGYYADITVFRPETVADTACVENPEGENIGIEKVLINGTMIYDGKDLADIHPGMIIRGK